MSDQHVAPDLKAVQTNNSSYNEKVDNSIDHALEKRAVLKLDITVLPMMALFYFLNFMVRIECCCHFEIADKRRNVGSCQYWYVPCPHRATP